MKYDQAFLKDGAFRICDNKGFHILFPNGVVLSTQFGGGNYGSNYHSNIGGQRATDGIAADTVEVAAFNKVGGKWRTREALLLAGKEDPQDDVHGYVGMKEWLEIFDAVRNLPTTRVKA